MRASRVVCSLFLLLLIVFFVAFGIYRQYLLTHFSCTGTIVVSNDFYRLSAQMNLQIEGGKGTLAVDGKVTDKQGGELPFRTISSLSVDRNKNYYTLTNINFVDLYGHQHSAEKNDVYPNFLKEKNSIITLTRFRQGEKGFILKHSSSIAYCKDDNL